MPVTTMVLPTVGRHLAGGAQRLFVGLLPFRAGGGSGR